MRICINNNYILLSYVIVIQAADKFCLLYNVFIDKILQRQEILFENEKIQPFESKALKHAYIKTMVDQTTYVAFGVLLPNSEL